MTCFIIIIIITITSYAYPISGVSIYYYILSFQQEYNDIENMNLLTLVAAIYIYS